MKRLVKKAGEWWDSELPGARSDKGEFAVVENNQILIYDDNGIQLRTISFFQLGITNKTNEKIIREKVIDTLSVYLADHRDFI